MENSAPKRTLTELDHVRLTDLVLRQQRNVLFDGSPLLLLERVLANAHVVPWRMLSGDVVSMHSRVVVKNPRTGQSHTVLLCYPALADASASFVSVLSALGRSLLGHRLGSTVSWIDTQGDDQLARIVAIPFQPEARRMAAL